jgi:hypothetical protein
MTFEEANGALYYWGPKIYQDFYSGMFQPLSKTDFQKGGMYERVGSDHPYDSLSVDLGLPTKTIGFYNKSRAEINRLQELYKKKGSFNPRADAYDEMKEKSISLMLEYPVRHVLITPLFMWRGIWCFPNSTIPFIGNTIQIYLHNIINFLSFIALFIVFIVALYKKRIRWLSISIIPVLMILFHAFATQNIPRFTEPAIPQMLMSLIIIAHLVLKFLKKSKSLDGITII